MARVPSADKSSTPATSQLGDSSESAGEESYLPPSRVLNALGLSNSKGSSRLVTPDSSEPTTQDMMTSRPARSQGQGHSNLAAPFC